MLVLASLIGQVAACSIPGIAMLASACGPAHTGWNHATLALDAPLADQDETPYAPRPQPSAAAGDRLALSMEAGEASARAATFALLQALIDADSVRLRALLADRIVYVLEGVTRPATEVITRCLQDTHSLAYEPGISAATLIDEGALEVRTARARFGEAALTPGIGADDLVVSLRPQLGPQGPRRIACLGTLYVRPGTRTLIVGLAR